MLTLISLVVGMLSYDQDLMLDISSDNFDWNIKFR